MKAKGFSLIELLISLAILSMLLLLGNFSYSLLAERWNRDLGNFNDQVAVFRSLDLVERLLVGIDDYVVLAPDGSLSGATPTFLFVGEEDNLVAVTSNPLFCNSCSELFKLEIVDNLNSETKALILHTYALEGVPITSVNQSFEYERSFVLLDDIVDAKFLYYGYAGLSEKLQQIREAVATSKAWTSAYSGVDEQLLPEIVLLKLTFEDGEFILQGELNQSTELKLDRYREFQ